MYHQSKNIRMKNLEILELKNNYFSSFILIIFLLYAIKFIIYLNALLLLLEIINYYISNA